MADIKPHSLPPPSAIHAAYYHTWRALILFSMRVLFGLRAYDRGNVPARGPILIAANHQSYLDPTAIGCPVSHRELLYIARAGLFKYKLFASAIASVNAIPIREDQGDTAAIKESLRRLDQGAGILIFPEGSRSEDGSIQPFKRGVALLMKKARCPVVPAAIHGGYEVWPRHRRFPRIFGPRVRVKYGRAIPYEELMRDGPDAALLRIEAEVRRLWLELQSQPAGHSQPSPTRT